ncbi:MAG: TonB-dependent receptor [Candidatus Omnitrophica bacterium]|nr:TonB-dependent receptor [Candidatus Omnitrophota bacterium]
MLKIKYHGFVFILILFGCLSLAEAGENQPETLEKIVITKERVYLTQAYSLKSVNFSTLAFDSPVEALNVTPLDLQARSPQAGIQTDFSLRASNFQGVLILLNSQRINDPQTGHHNSDIPLTTEDLEKIDLIPGTGSSLFGSDSIGGAINFIVKKPEVRKIVLEVSGGQHKTFSGLFSATEKINNLGVRISVENKESLGFSEDTDYKKFTSNIASSLDIPDGEINLNYGYQDKEFGAYDFYTPGKGYESKEWTKTHLLDTGLKLNKAGFLIKPNFLWRRHHDKFMLDKTMIRSSSVNHHRTDILTPNIYFQKELEKIGRLGLGLEYGEEKISSDSLGHHTRRHSSLFLDNAKDLTDKLSFGLSWRFDDYNSSEKVYTGSINLRYQILVDSYLRFGVSRSMRLPSFTELYYSDDGYTVGNVNLSSEKSMNYETGFDFKKERLSGGITFFLRDERNFIDWIQNTSSPVRWQAKNISDAKVFGIEERLKLEINKIISLDANYTYINKDADDSGYIYKYGANYIRHLFNAECMLKLPFGTQSIGFTYKKKPVRGGWWLVNTRLNYSLNKQAQIFLAVTNLFNVEYQEIEGIPQPGRWVEGGLRLNW